MEDLNKTNLLSENAPEDLSDLWTLFYEDFDFENEVEIYWSENPRLREDLKYEAQTDSSGVKDYKFVTTTQLSFLDEGRFPTESQMQDFMHFYEVSEVESSYIDVFVSPHISHVSEVRKEINFNGMLLSAFETTLKIDWSIRL